MKKTKLKKLSIKSEIDHLEGTIFKYLYFDINSSIITEKFLEYIKLVRKGKI